MALNTQLGGTPGYTDMPFFNWSGTDIPAGICVKVDATNTVGAGQQGYGCILPAGAGDPVVGVTVDPIKAGTAGRVRCPGPIAQCIADGGVTAGTFVMASGTAGKLGYVKTQTAGLPTVGLALTTAVDSDSVNVLQGVAKNA